MLKISKTKYQKMKQLSDQNDVIAALAIDQRGSLRKMIAAGSETGEAKVEDIQRFKSLVSKHLTPYSSSILLDPEYGLPAADVRDAESGLIIAYEETGYDATSTDRLPDLLPEWSVRRIAALNADAVKILLYYDVEGDTKVNDYKQAFIERVGSECEAEEIPYFLEILTYDEQIEDVKSKEYAEVKAHKVNEAMRVFSDSVYKVDVLKVEVPVNMNYVEGYCDASEQLYTAEEAEQLFVQQSEATHLPFIFLSAGVSAKLFQDTLEFAHTAGSTFNGVLCGRATWKESVPIFGGGGDEAAIEWLKAEGKENIENLNEVLKRTAQSWTTKVEQI